MSFRSLRQIRADDAAQAVEARAINKSLAALGTVLRALAKPRLQAPVQYSPGSLEADDSYSSDVRSKASHSDSTQGSASRRSSQAKRSFQGALRSQFRSCALTRVLQGSLASADSLVLVLGCVSPAFDAHREAIGTLQFMADAARMRSLPGLPPGLDAEAVRERMLPSPPRPVVVSRLGLDDCDRSDDCNASPDDEERKSSEGIDKTGGKEDPPETPRSDPCDVRA